VAAGPAAGLDVLGVAATSPGVELDADEVTGSLADPAVRKAISAR
jgi:hypothetical protein